MRQAMRASGRVLATGLAGFTVIATLVACGTTGAPGSLAGSAAATAGTAAKATASAGMPSVASSPDHTTAAAISSSGAQGTLPIYWVAESRRKLAVYREFREVPDNGGPIASAVSAMTRLKPLDPDYLNPWRPASRVTASQSGPAITVDLSADAFANTQVGSELADRAVQQLVYTATAAAQQAGIHARTVKITVDGAAFDAWGAVRLGMPMERAPMIAVQAPTWVTSPQEGETRPAGNVIFKGFGTSFEANFVWEVRNASGTRVAHGFTNGGANGTFGEFTFAARLTTGTYSVEVSDDDASGGAEGPGTATDNKTFTVN